MVPARSCATSKVCNSLRGRRLPESRRSASTRQALRFGIQSRLVRFRRRGEGGRPPRGRRRFRVAREAFQILLRSGPRSACAPRRRRSARTSLNSRSIFRARPSGARPLERRRQRLSEGRHHAPPFLVVEAELLPIIILEAPRAPGGATASAGFPGPWSRCRRAGCSCGGVSCPCFSCPLAECSRRSLRTATSDVVGWWAMRFTRSLYGLQLQQHSTVAGCARGWTHSGYVCACVCQLHAQSTRLVSLNR